MKRLLILIILLFSLISLKAQILNPYRAVDIGVGANLNTAAGDVETFKRTTGFHFNVNVNLDYFTTVIAEIQMGQLAGGDSINNYSGRQFTNQFNSFCFRGQMQLGRVFENFPDAVQRIYLSSGIGGISNNITKVSRSSILIPGYGTTGKDKSINFFVPARIGYEFPIKNAYKETMFKIDLGFQYNFVLGDEIDGYTVGKFKDTYSQLSVGFKKGVFGRRW